MDAKVIVCAAPELFTIIKNMLSEGKDPEQVLLPYCESDVEIKINEFASVDECGDSIIHLLCKHGLYELLEKLHEMKVYENDFYSLVNQVNHDGKTPMYLALEYGREAKMTACNILTYGREAEVRAYNIVTLLRLYRPDPNLRPSPQHDTCLGMVLQFESRQFLFDLTFDLIALKADANIVRPDGTTHLMMIFKFFNKYINLKCDAHLYVNTRYQNFSPSGDLDFSYQAVRSAEHKFLYGAGLDAEANDEFFCRILRLLLKGGACPDGYLPDGNTYLMAAVEKMNDVNALAQAARAFLHYGVDIKKCSETGRTLFGVILSLDDAEKINVLMRVLLRIINVNQKVMLSINDKPTTWLEEVINHPNIGVPNLLVDSLLNAGVNPNLMVAQVYPPLMQAINRMVANSELLSEQIVMLYALKSLVIAGAARDCAVEGDTALLAAMELPYQTMWFALKYLLDAPSNLGEVRGLKTKVTQYPKSIDLNKHLLSGDTYLTAALKNIEDPSKLILFVEQLLIHGASIDLLTKDGQSFWEILLVQDSQKIMRLIELLLHEVKVNQNSCIHDHGRLLSFLIKLLQSKNPHLMRIAVQEGWALMLNMDTRPLLAALTLPIEEALSVIENLATISEETSFKNTMQAGCGAYRVPVFANQKDKYGNLPLIRAIENYASSEEKNKLLYLLILKHDVSCSARDAKGRCALDVAMGDELMVLLNAEIINGNFALVNDVLDSENFKLPNATKWSEKIWFNFFKNVDSFADIDADVTLDLLVNKHDFNVNCIVNDKDLLIFALEQFFEASAVPIEATNSLICGLLEWGANWESALAQLERPLSDELQNEIRVYSIFTLEFCLEELVADILLDVQKNVAANLTGIDEVTVLETSRQEIQYGRYVCEKFPRSDKFVTLSEELKQLDKQIETDLRRLSREMSIDTVADVSVPYRSSIDSGSSAGAVDGEPAVEPGLGNAHFGYGLK